MQFSKNFSTLVIAEQFRGSFGNFKNVVSAASQFNEPVHVFCAGSNPSDFATASSKTSGVEKVLVAKHDSLEDPLPTDLAAITQHLIEQNSYNRVLTASTSIGKDFLPRVGGKLDSQPITDVIKIHSEDTFDRPVYAGNAISTVKNQRIK